MKNSGPFGVCCGVEINMEIFQSAQKSLPSIGHRGRPSLWPVR